MEARKNSTPGESEGTCQDHSGAICVTLTDTDVLDCPICFEPLSSPVYQCENGHISCASCCTTMKNKCPSCSMPIGYNRCRAIEKVLESIRIACRNRQYGCMETLNSSGIRVHENTCINASCSCPHPGCNYVKTSKFLYTHFSTLHSNSSKQFVFFDHFYISMDNTQKHVFLQEKNEGTVFVINRSMESFGSFVNVVCVAPTSGKRRFQYLVSASAVEGGTVSLRTRAECIMKWTVQRPAKTFLMVPSDFISISGQMKLGLMMWEDR